ncbi:MAG TPA: hypothetical protein DEB55_16595 [Microbacterium sp.]|uniref:hypothetical protein n=1 Tax=Microbacterium sp. UBA1612 TaxID=1946942 RepID=UPI000E98933A|nr:hypothetical protein [Microbacterium sp. UBA1612]HBS75979.1 hypothetical protein [Microbacterium sp.]|tara:strand:- start:14848 stop:15774 length:927 start_codon:yes stop_codon:yes gene_type:complete
MSEPRNLLKGWCPVGRSFPNGLRAFGDDSRIQRLDAHLKSLTGLRSGEPGAAWALAAHTGLWPEPRDGAEAGQRLVDLVLQGEGDYLEVAEVMQTTDAEFMRRFRTMSDRIVPAVHVAYNGVHSWGLEFERFVELPPSQRDLQQRAPAWAEVLASADPEAGTVELGPGLSARPFSDERPPGVYFSSANAEIAERPETPYLERLSEYLATDANIARHIEKLRTESATLAARRSHLYLPVAANGENGDLLALSPSLFTWGTFTPIEGVTDLWLANGLDIFHWSAETGWVYHPDTDERAESARAHVAGPNS